VAVDLERHRGVTEASPRRHGGPAVRPRSRHRVRHRSSEWRQSGARRLGDCRHRPSRQSASRSGHGVRRDRPFEVAGVMALTEIPQSRSLKFPSEPLGGSGCL
jgi:hypothetical protein